jgi:hypothetical protein
MKDGVFFFAIISFDCLAACCARFVLPSHGY